MLKLSVIIPTYNRLPIFSRALSSFLSQEVPVSEYEILVVDDGSSDGTGGFMSDFVSRHGNTRYFKQTHKGPAAARNLGVSNAGGRYIFFTGDDIIASKGLLKAHLNTLEAHAHTAVLGFTDWDKNIRPSEFMNFLIRNGHQFNWQGLKDKEYCPWRVFYTCNVSLEKRWLEEELFDENFSFPVWEDIELSYRFFKKGLKIIFNPGALAYHSHFISESDFYNRARQSGFSRVYLYGKHPELRTLSFKLAQTRLALLVMKGLIFCERILRFLGLNILAWELNLWYYAMLGIREGINKYGISGQSPDKLVRRGTPRGDKQLNLGQSSE